jgi:AbiTii
MKEINQETIKKALDGKGKLSKVLSELQKFAEDKNDDDLADWCFKELHGYDNNDKPTHRITDTILDNRRTINSKMLFGNNTAVGDPKFYLESVTQIEESFDNKTHAKVRETVQVSKVLSALVGEFYVEHKKLPKLLAQIRQEAKKRFLQSTRVKTVSYPMPNFPSLVSNAEFARILSGRWNEANLAHENGAYLATIILLGSLLEGYLICKVKENQTISRSSSKCPKFVKGKRAGKIKPISQWSFEDLINVGHACGFLKNGLSKFAQEIRNFRNFVHPNKQFKEKTEFDSELCEIVWKVVSAALI